MRVRLSWTSKQLTPRRTRVLLLLITLCAIALRVAALRFPSALTDEAFTFWRVCGPFGQLLDTLLSDAFLPLFYEITWLLTKAFGTDIAVLRLLPAVAGMAMPYAVYRLGRITGGRRVGIISAAVAAASAFLAFYARNAKMYSPGWLMLTLALGSLLFFAKSRAGTRSRRLALLTFMFFGASATAMHAVLCIPLAVSPLIAFAWARRTPTCSRRACTPFSPAQTTSMLAGYTWRSPVFKTTLLATLGTLAVMAGPAIYYSAINTWFQSAGGLSGRSETGPAQHDNGLMWIDNWQSDRSPLNITKQCLTAYAAGTESPADAEVQTDPLAERVRHATNAVLIAALVCAALAIGNAACRKRHGLTLAPAVSLLLLVGLPLYLFYLRSFRSLAAPWDLGWIAWTITLCAATAIFVGHPRWHRRMGRQFACAIAFVGITAVALTITWLSARYAYTHAPLDANGLPRWNPLWMPRYSGFVAPLLCVVLGSIIAGTPTMPLRLLIGCAVLGINLWVTLLSLHEETEISFQRLTQDVVAASRSNGPPVMMDWILLPHQLFLPSMPSPHYELVQAADLPGLTPLSFRTGQTWPYRPGLDVRRMVASLRYQPAMLLQSTAAKTKPDTIILWRNGHAATTDPPRVPGYHVADDQHFKVRAVWNWQLVFNYERIVLKRN
ncbi:MAG: rane protein-like protein [Phycisphaerales bacterium]|nr:rane protein-like protein [Phycisphaerales bacterium]